VVDRAQVEGKICRQPSEEEILSSAVFPSASPRLEKTLNLPGAEGARRAEIGHALRRLLALTRPHRRLMLWSFALAVALVGSNLTIPYLFGLAIGDIEAKDESRIVLFGLLIIAAGTARMVFASLREISMGMMGINVEVDVRNRLYKHMLHLDGTFHARQRAGELVSRIMVTSGPIKNFLAQALPLLLEDVLSLLLTAVILLLLEPTLALVVLWPTPLVVWLAIRFSRRVAPAMEERQECLAAMTGEADETLQGSIPVKLLRAEEVRLKSFHRRIADWYAASQRINVTRAIYDPAVASLPDLGRAALLVWGGLAAIEARLDLATLVIFLGYLGILLGPIQGLCDTLSFLQNAMASANRLFAVLDETPTVVSRDGAVEIPPAPTELLLRRVSKRWHPGRDAVSEVQLAIAAGHSVAILGRAGSGKSALLQLVNRVYDPDAGELHAGDVRFTEVELKSLRRLIVTVGSAPHLFPISLRENLTYGAPGADEERMHAVVAALGLAPVIAKLPFAYDTMISERGEPLTVAEAQLVNLVQAILTEPGILLLDDVTAPFPPELERRVIEGLRTLCHGITVISVANRPALLRLADEVIILDRGRLVARGAAADLLIDSPPFQEFLHRWGIDVALPGISADSSRAPPPEPIRGRRERNGSLSTPG
jgi:ATP-binding cassette, subfamily B, bacterial